VVVLDISMPVMNGLQATKFLRDLRCRSRIVILTTYEDKEYIDAAFSCGANAFVTKQSLASDSDGYSYSVSRQFIYLTVVEPPRGLSSDDVVPYREFD
jgi:DNA-binding NarL/FixJ family response regulator